MFVLAARVHAHTRLEHAKGAKREVMTYQVAEKLARRHVGRTCLRGRARRLREVLLLYDAAIASECSITDVRKAGCVGNAYDADGLLPDGIRAAPPGATATRVSAGYRTWHAGIAELTRPAFAEAWRHVVRVEVHGNIASFDSDAVDKAAQHLDVLREQRVCIPW
eukprot:3463618-Rhodomonas_salina.5